MYIYMYIYIYIFLYLSTGCHHARGGTLVGPPAPFGPRALVGPLGQLWAGPLWAPLGPCGLGRNGPSYDICIYIYIYGDTYIYIFFE